MTKKQTEDFKKKRKETLSKKKENVKEKKQQLVELKTKLIEEEFKNNFKENMEQRLFDLKYKLKHLDRENNLTLMEIDSLLRNKSIVGNTTEYSTEELEIAFKYYRDFIVAINKENIDYIPSKKNFSAFIGISSATYDSYMESQDTGKVEIMKIIDDYISDIQLTLAQNGKLKEISTIFRGKTEHKMVEATAPIIFRREEDINYKEMEKRFEAIERGKKMKEIELKPNKNGIYEEDTNEDN